MLLDVLCLSESLIIFKICADFANPVVHEVCSPIISLQAINYILLEINQKPCAVYGDNVMSEMEERQQHLMFKNGCTNVHDE